jgi:deoxycytidylate deaminase
MRKLVIYLPVLHRGYVDLVKKFQQAGGGVVYLLEPAQLQELGAPTHKDIHGLTTEEIKAGLDAIIRGWMAEEGVKPERWEVRRGESKKEIEAEREDDDEWWLPEEEVMRQWVKKRGWPRKNIKWQRVFLRWDREKATAEKEPLVDEEITQEEGERRMMAIAEENGALSSDWWRKVGAVITRENEKGEKEMLGAAHNTHLPSEQTPNIEGDIRAQFNQGKQWELGTAIHAEAGAIAAAARRGVALEGAEIWVSDFPCPNCAKLIAAAGIKTVYYRRGYAVSDGERVLRSAGVRIVRVG